MLLPLESYARQRDAFRQEAMRQRKLRRLMLGEHISLHFENTLTIQYQVQEMLRAERIFEPREVEAELAAYLPLVPDGGNWKATMMLEFPDPEERAHHLAALRQVEDCLQIQVGNLPPVRGIADEDMPRSNEHKTSAVHFLRFQFSKDHVRSLIDDTPQVVLMVDHPAYQASSEVSLPLLNALRADLKPSP